MENKSHAFAAGIFVLSMLALLIATITWMTRDKGQYSTYEMTSQQGVTGLQEGSAVRYKGVTVGKVLYIGFDPEKSGNVLMRISVEQGAPIDGHTFASLGYQGVTGLAFIDLDSSSEQVSMKTKSSRGYRWLAWQPSSLSKLAAMGPEVIGDVRETLGQITAMLSDENSLLMTQALTGINETAKNTASLTKQFENSWTKDITPAISSLSKDASESMKALQTAANSLRALSVEVDEIAVRLNQSDGTIDQVNQAVNAFSNTAKELNANVLPKFNRTLSAIENSMYDISILSTEIGNNPQSFIYGQRDGQPGPGETGFVVPQP